MPEILTMLLGALCGYLMGELVHYYQREDTQVIREEAQHIVDRLERILAEIRPIDTRQTYKADVQEDISKWSPLP